SPGRRGLKVTLTRRSSLRMGAAHGQGPHDVLDPAPIIAAAQQAAAAGDYSEAERLLREAAARHELRLGPPHPDLPRQHNNLAPAVVVAAACAVHRRGTTDTSDPLLQPRNRPSANDSPATSVTTPAPAGQQQPAVTLERRADTTPAPVERPNPPETGITAASV